MMNFPRNNRINPNLLNPAVRKVLRPLLLAAALTQPALAAVDLAAIDLASQQQDLAALQQQTVVAQDDYQFAYAQYRLAVAASVRGDETLLKPALQAAAERLEQLLKAEPEEDLTVEAWALLALTRGMQAGYYPIKGAYYGKLSGDALAKSKELQADNPRVLLAGAILAYQTPTLFGGDKKQALVQAEAAVQAFAKPCQQICWGQAEAYVWRGLAKKEAGDSAGAKADWTEALRQQPDYGWAKHLLQGS
ncbi:hypothetical protein [Rheinheimera sp. 4Y26]|uniref:hypothetical protein n=1 Tax=Rheinheimera sp. 4Y26 TaxID=2977811 RepID=UPI0021B0E993|nr:hypothetical protein [Rheinheimera sp. 4Y26]MCT6698063.1 hypothetical protein [Rheinheimera sp. 4Y26]